MQETITANKSDLKQYLEYLRGIHLNPHTFRREYDLAISKYESQSTEIATLTVRLINILKREDTIKDRLLRQGKTTTDIDLPVETLRDLNALHQELKTVVLDQRDRSLLVIDMLYSIITEAANVVEMAKGAEAAKEMVAEQKNLFKDIHATVHSSFQQELQRAEELNQRQMDLFQFALGQIVAKLDIVQIAKLCDKYALETRSKEYRRKEEEFDSEAQELSQKEQEAIYALDKIKDDYENKLKQKNADSETIKKDYETRIEALNKELVAVQSKGKTLNAMAVSVAASAETIEQASHGNETVKYDEPYWKNRLKKKYNVAVTLFKNNGDTKITAEKHGLAQGYVSNIKTYMKKNHLQRKFEEFVGGLASLEAKKETTSDKSAIEEPKKEIETEAD